MTDTELPEPIPRDILAHDDDVLKRICNHLGEKGVLNHPNRTTHLTIEVTAGELVEVVAVEEDDHA